MKSNPKLLSKDIREFVSPTSCSLLIDFFKNKLIREATTKNSMLIITQPFMEKRFRKHQYSLSLLISPKKILICKATNNLFGKKKTFLEKN